MGAAVPTMGTVPSLAPPGTPAREAVALGTKRTVFTYKQVQACAQEPTARGRRAWTRGQGPRKVIT